MMTNRYIYQVNVNQRRAILLILVVLMPLLLVSVRATLSDVNLIEFCECAGEEDSNSEQESEEKSSKDGLEEFVIHPGGQSAMLLSKKGVYFARMKSVLCISREVSTPPPECLF